jgi:hypothetical protein
MRYLIPILAAILLSASPAGTQPPTNATKDVELILGTAPSVGGSITVGHGPQPRAGPFVRFFVVWKLPVPQTYGFADTRVDCAQAYAVKRLTLGGGLAARPWAKAPGLEFRLGAGDRYDVHRREWKPGLYGEVRYVY